NFFFDGDFKPLTADLHHKYGDICESRLGGFRRIVISKTDYFENLLSASKNLALFAKLKINQQWILVENLDEDYFLIAIMRIGKLI
ncbi:3356_t:CDS:1, partial [Gigaspora rosea]